MLMVGAFFWSQVVELSWTYDINMPRISQDGRALDMLSEGRGFKSRSELKFLKALDWRLHVRFPRSYVENELYLT